MQYDILTLQELRQKIENKKNIFLAAAGNYGTIMGEYFNKFLVAWDGYVDGNEQKQGLKLNEKNIYGYEKLKNYPDAVVVICTIMRAKEIEELILAQGLRDENIIRFDCRYVFELANYSILSPQDKIDKIKMLKNIAGERNRCFIIATGPSLTISDLEALKNEFTISVNSIIRSFPETDWRPSCYVAQDPAEYEIDIKDYGIERLSKECNYLVFGIKTGMFFMADEYENMFFFNSLDEPYKETPRFSDDISKVVYGSSTVIYSALQIAVYMGFKEIYMVGADMGFATVRNQTGKVEHRKDTLSTASFLKSTVEEAPVYEEEKIIRGYRAAKKFAETKDIILKNATRGGYLEELERISLDELLCE